MLKKLMPYLKGYRREIWLSVLCSALESVFSLLIPLAMASIMDRGVQTSDLAYTVRLGLVMVLMALLVVAAGIYSMKYATRVGLGLGTSLRSAAYRKIQTFSFENLEQFGTASLITRLTTDVTTIQMTTIQTVKYLVRAPSMMLFSVIFSFLISPKLAWMFVALIPVVTAAIVLVIWKLRPLYQKMQRSIDQMNQVVQENIIGIALVKIFGRQNQQKSLFAKSNAQVYTTSDKAMGLSVLASPLGNAILYTGTILLYWYGGRDIMVGGLMVGQLSSLSAYLADILSRVVMLANLSVLISRSLVSFQRLLEVLQTKSSILSGPEEAGLTEGSIRFEQVRFHYAGSPELLAGLDLEIPAGQSVGIIGATGAGKTTLVSLIPRLYDVSGGRVLVSGRDVRDYPLDVLRREIAFVPQTSMLFSGTVAENLRWGKPDATLEELQAACRAACADGFIRALPQGYDTPIGQGGSNLSGGQRQRLCVARAILKQPRILILDDAASAVDMATDAAMTRAFQTLLPGATKLVIAQRISSIAWADRILVLDKGAVVGDGTHETLLETCPLYQELCALQHVQEEAVYA